MGLGLGNYVHLYQDNYEKYGINMYGSGTGESFENSLQQQKEKIVNIIEQNQVDLHALKLQKYLNNLRHMGNAYSNSHLTQQDKQAMEQRFVQAVQQSLQKQVGLVWDNLSVEQKYTNPYLSKLNKYKGINIKGQKSIELKTINNLMNQINQVLNETASDIKSSKAYAKDFNLLERVYGQLKTIAQRYANQSAYTNINFNTRISNTGRGVTLGDVLKQYNTVLKTASLLTEKEIGDVAEIQVAILLEQMHGKSKKTINELLNTYIVGGLSATTKVTMPNGNKFVGDQILRKENFNLDENKQASISSQQTVDVNITIQDPSDQAEKNIRASVKNYSNAATQDIKVISGTNLFNLLGIAENNFANHYLNLVANQQNSDGSLIYYWHNANNILTLLLLARGVLGYRGVSNDINNNANYLIINDRSTSQFKVFSTAKIIEYLFNNLDAINSYVSLGQNFPAYNSLKNDRHPKWWGARIANLLVEIKKYNLSASLRPSLLNSIK